MLEDMKMRLLLRICLRYVEHEDEEQHTIIRLRCVVYVCVYLVVVCRAYRNAAFFRVRVGLRLNSAFGLFLRDLQTGGASRFFSEAGTFVAL